jgi:membrane protein YdbS with pleckstrin-like domain
MKIPQPVTTAFSALLRLPPPPDAPPGDEATAVVFRASPQYLRYRTMLWAFLAVPLLLAGVAPLILLTTQPLRVNDAPLSPLSLAAIVLALVALPVGIWWALIRLDFAWRWYVVTDRSVRIREGIWHVREMTVTFANVQNLSIEQGPLQRLFGISDVRVDTAGGGAGAAVAKQGHAGRQLNLHAAWLRGLDNADFVRTAIQQRLRGRVDAGLGDPEDAGHSVKASPDSLWAAAAILEEAKALHAAARRLAGPPHASAAPLPHA